MRILLRYQLKMGDAKKSGTDCNLLPHLVERGGYAKSSKMPIGKRIQHTRSVRTDNWVKIAVFSSGWGLVVGML